MSDGRLVLALDTSTVAAVGLARGGELLASERFDDTRAHVEQLLPLVRAVLDGAGLALGDVERLVVGTGPGPFTGLRVGIATAEVLALALGAPLTGVTSLDVLARQVARSGSAPEEFLVVSDARRREVYWSRHDDTGRRLQGPEVGAPDSLPGLPVAGPGTDVDPALAARGTGLARDLDAGVMALEVDLLPDTGLEPLYLRRPDATVPGRPKSTLVAPPPRLRPRPRPEGSR